MSDSERSNPSPQERTYRDPWWVNGVLFSLSPDDEIYINDRTHGLHVIERTAPADDTLITLTLVGYGTEYTAHIPTDATDWEQSPWLETNAGKEVEVTRLRAVDSPLVVISDLTAHEYLRSRLHPPIEDRSLSAPDPTNRDGSRVGSCPKCGGSVIVEHETRVACTKCPRWCWREEWERYQDTN